MIDVVVVGASVAGCTAAMRLGRAGLRVAVIERSRSMDAYKALCGHYILGGARPTLERLGLWQEIIAAGGVTSAPSLWTGEGWVLPTPEVPEAISLRRAVLDPLLRQAAADTVGVELHLGHTVTGVLAHGRRIVGVEARRHDGQDVRFDAPLVVAADGHRSPVAELASVRASSAPNARFLYWGYYRGVRLRSPGAAAVWFVDPDVAVAVPTDDGMTLLGAFPAKGRLGDFDDHRLDAIEQFFSQLPDAPDLTDAARASKAIGTSDYPMVRRHPTPRPGLALIGDAATSSDPVPAVGCGWAFRSAEFLADSVIPAFDGSTSMRTALRAYRRKHRFIDGHDRLLRTDARGQGPNPVQRAIRRAALHDEDIATRLGRFAMRADAASALVNPRTALRAMRISRRAPGRLVERSWLSQPS